nr:immunoglobulin heavy chain junction region [Mus musculus]
LCKTCGWLLPLLCYGLL